MQCTGPGGIRVNPAPGHLLFEAQGMYVRERDVLEFLARYLGTSSKEVSTGAAKSRQ